MNTPDGHILLIEDDAAFRAMLAEALESRNYAVKAVSTAEDGIKSLEGSAFDLILTDVKLPGMSGVEALPRLIKAGQGADIIVMTAYSSREMALEAVRLGAYDFFSKPFSLKELEVVVRRAMEKRRLQHEVKSLRASLRREGPSTRLIGQSAAVNDVISMVERIAPLDTTVLITGESGTGKELVTDTLRALSPRASGPFIKVNCAAIPEHLFENELFGHERGAFTGASSSQPGKFELARGGTILLDEIGDMPLSIQPKLLRVVEQKQVERLGASRPISVDVRIIAATNQNLLERIGQKQFREDLYYRLNVATITLPPLRERTGDVPLLAEFFLRRIRASLGINIEGISAEAMQFMTEYQWPGNVRQLANVLEGAAIASESNTIELGDIRRIIGTGDTKDVSPHLTLKQAVTQFERSLIIKALRRCDGVQTEAAKSLGLTPKNLWAKIKKHDIDPKRLTN